MAKIINPHIHKISQPLKIQPKKHQSEAGDFNSVLRKELDQITLSKHAKKRLENRGISMDISTMDKLNTAMDKLSDKGSKDSLILLNQVAYIVNPKDKVIITAVDKENLQENIFTGIDSAIII